MTVLLQLVRDGTASLDDTIDKCLPGIPNGNRITLAQLAGMENGVKDYSQAPAFVEEFAPDPGRVWGDVLRSGRLLTPELQMLRITHFHPATDGREYDLYGLGIGSV